MYVSKSLGYSILNLSSSNTVCVLGLIVAPLAWYSKIVYVLCYIPTLFDISVYKCSILQIWLKIWFSMRLISATAFHVILAYVAMTHPGHQNLRSPIGCCVVIYRHFIKQYATFLLKGLYPMIHYNLCHINQSITFFANTTLVPCKPCDLIFLLRQKNKSTIE